MIAKVTLIVLLAVMCIIWGEAGSVGGSAEFHHQAPDQHKLSPGWQEPGLWRPRWVMDRTFDATEEGHPAREDRIYFKLKSDRTMKIVDPRNRPVLEVFKPKTVIEKKKRLFESEDEQENADGSADGDAQDKVASSSSSSTSNRKRTITKESDFDLASEEIDGTWWWQDAAPLKGAKVKLETREGKEKEERIMHDGFCEWGVLDGYAARFKVGKILKYKMTESGVPLGSQQAGSFILRVNTHRPLVGKEFLAFE